ncbi:MAG: hypothetical protein ACOYIG_07310 [Acetivibrionales bacterium]|jgi:hypothetical protein|nr:hypothetical protein [Clostridiaceae bacterium]
MDKLNNEISEKSFDEKEEKILIEGEFKKTVFIIGLVLAIFCIITSLISLYKRNDSMIAGLDYIILISSAYFMTLSVKEILLNRKRKISVTENRMFGNTGHDSFDLLYSEIESVEQKSRRDIFYGDIHYLYIKTNTNTELKIEQLKNLEKVNQVIKSKR